MGFDVYPRDDSKSTYVHMLARIAALACLKNKTWLTTATTKGPEQLRIECVVNYLDLATGSDSLELYNI
jgi:hypothetical protein